jgi:CBS domain-containing protein
MSLGIRSTYSSKKVTLMKIKEVMHTGATWVDPNTTLSQIAKKMRDEDIGAVPVGENDRLVGMVTDRDICCRAFADGRDISKLSARDVMSSPIAYCKAEDDLTEAIRAMESRKVRRLPVINEKKRLVGMLSLGDIWQKATDDLSPAVMRAVSTITQKSSM